VLNNNCARCEYGNLNTDATHHFSFTGNYAIPGHKAPLQLLEGWSINTSVNYLSGLPLNVLDSSLDTSGTEALASSKVDRWNLSGPATPFNNIIGGAGLMPCYGVASSSFAKSGVCTTVAAGTAGSNVGTPAFVANMPAACVAAAQANSPSNGGAYNLATNPNLTAPTPGTTLASAGMYGYNGLAQLAEVGCYFVNGSAILPPAQGTFGNMSRNGLRGKPFGLWNASVTKDIKIKEKLTAQFRAEFFNVLNTTLYSSVGANLGSPKSFGQASSTPDVSKSNPVVGSGGPREIQLGLKLTF
jgi:hypothetical protein